MRKICIVPFEEFWKKLADHDPKAVQLMFSAYSDSPDTPDTPENRRKAYNAMIAHYRATNRLCEHPSHNHPVTLQ